MGDNNTNNRSAVLMLFGIIVIVSGIMITATGGFCVSIEGFSEIGMVFFLLAVMGLATVYGGILLIKQSRKSK